MKKYLLLLAVPFLISACTSNFKEKMEEDDDNLQTFSQVIKKDNIKSLRTEISMAAGYLKLEKGSTDLADANIKYTREKWKPEITYSSSGETGKIIIAQSEKTEFNFSNDDKNNWTIKLNPEIYQDIKLALGAGVSEINLSDFTLSGVSIEAGVGEHNINLSNTSVPYLDIDAGVGEVTVDLTGIWKNDLDATINGGIGELNMILPKNTGIILKINGGLGSVNAPSFTKIGRTYTNENYGSSNFTLEFEINAGMGSINIELKD